MAESAPSEQSREPPTAGDLRHKLIRGGILLGVLVAVGVALLALRPGLSEVRSAIEGASAGWILAAAVIQLVGVAGAVVLVQLVFADEPHRLTARMGGAQQGANAVLPTAGSTGVGYWTLSSIGWGAQRFAERTAVLIIAPAVPNIVLIFLLGLPLRLSEWLASSIAW